MRVLLSTIGSRGDVQPIVALGLELRAIGQNVRLCVPPDFRGWDRSGWMSFQARTVAQSVRTDSARVAAQRLCA